MRDASEDRLDRHALVIAVWLAAGVAALVGFRLAFGAGGPVWLVAGFGAIVAGFAAHLIVNAVTATGFTPREVALGLVLALGGLLALPLATLLVPGFGARYLMPLAGGAAVLVAVALSAMVIRHGPRRSLELFDAARDTNPRAAQPPDASGGPQVTPLLLTLLAFLTALAVYVAAWSRIRVRRVL